MKSWKKIFSFLVWCCLVVAGFLLFSWYFVEYIWGKNIVDIDHIPDGYGTALVLGTSPYLHDGRGNLFYIYRMDAIKELVDAGKVKHVLVSGDNRKKEYNEPQEMKESLVDLWIDEAMIELDYAGFRTLDSVVRSDTVFSASPMIIVSQQFHLERALTIAHAWNIDAVGYPAKDVSLDIAPRVYLREILARGKMILDLYVFGTKPKFEE